MTDIERLKDYKNAIEKACKLDVESTNIVKDQDYIKELYSERIHIFDNAIAALEKQIPKKPNIHGYREGREVNTISYTCPVCNKHIGRENFCKHCGTALDWSDTE